MAKRDIDINMNVTFWLKTADKLNNKYYEFPGDLFNITNYEYSEDKKNTDSICHIDIDKLSDKKDDNEPICFVLQTMYIIQAFIVSKKDKTEFIKTVARAYYENREDIAMLDVKLRLLDNKIHYASLCPDMASVESGPHRTFRQAIDSLAKDMPAYRVEMEMLEPCHVEIHLCRIGENEWARYLISIYEKED